MRDDMLIALSLAATNHVLGVADRTHGHDSSKPAHHQHQHRHHAAKHDASGQRSGHDDGQSAGEEKDRAPLVQFDLQPKSNAKSGVKLKSTSSPSTISNESTNAPSPSASSSLSAMSSMIRVREPIQLIASLKRIQGVIQLIFKLISNRQTFIDLPCAVFGGVIKTGVKPIVIDRNTSSLIAAVQRGFEVAHQFRLHYQATHAHVGFCLEY
jgi:hypothetical protein